MVYWKNVLPRSFVVNWRREPSASCYFVELLLGYTIRVLKTVACHKRTSYKFTKLTPYRIYGVRVSVVNSRCVRGSPGMPARTRTLWAPTTKPPAPPKPTPKPGACGVGKFTCHSNPDECIPNEQWCNRRLDCRDESDERACPGGCEEIDSEFPNGNFTCSRWGSPSSYCWFDCDGDYALRGQKYTTCSKKLKKWTNPVPICIPKRTETVSIVDITDDSISISWAEIEVAVAYYIEFVQTSGGNKKNMTVNAAECCNGVMKDLKPTTEYKVTVSGVDYEGLEGFKSSPLFAFTTDGNA